MLIDGFNSDAVNVLRVAHKEPHNLGHNYVGTEHILIGLITEDSGEQPQIIISIGEMTVTPSPGEHDFGIAARVVKAAGVTVENARIELEKIVGRGPGLGAHEPPLTANARRLIELAREEERRLSDETDTT